MLRILPYLLLLILPLAGRAQTIRFEGSDLLAPVLNDLLDAYRQRHPDIKIDATMDGSYNATQALEQGQADIAVIALPDGDPAPGDAYVTEPLGFDVLTLLVNSQNPLKEIGIPSLAAIFGSRETRSFTKWGDLGLQDTWSTRAITMNLPDNNFGIYRSMFTQMVLKDAPLKDNVADWSKRKELLDQVTADGAAIAAYPGLPEGSAVRALFIAKEDGGFAYPPTDDSIFFGDYPLRLPYLIVFKKDAGAEVRALAAYLLEDEVAGKLRTAGLVPVPDSERRARTMQLSQPAK